MITPEEHQELLEMVSEYLFGELGPEDTERMERHLQECGGCHREVDSLRPVAAALRVLKQDWADGPEPPADLEERVLARIRDSA